MFPKQMRWSPTPKQKSYWQENAPDKFYRYDYIMALIMHSISWTFMVMLPIAYVNQFNVGVGFIGMFIANVAIHAAVDDLKANMKLINLWHDQLMHLGQIVLMILLIV